MTYYIVFEDGTQLHKWAKSLEELLFIVDALISEGHGECVRCERMIKRAIFGKLDEWERLW